MSAPDQSLGAVPQPSQSLAGRSTRRYDGAIEWTFPGHGTPGPDCGVPRKVGHVARPPEEDVGKWHIWETERTCGGADCPLCFNKPDGYCDRESGKIDLRLGLYFQLRNLILVREGWRRRSGLLSRRARDLLSYLQAEDIAPTSEDRWLDSDRARETARRLLRMADRERGRSRVRRVIHVVVAPPESRWSEVHRAGSYRSLRAEAYRQAEDRGVDAGVAIFHHKRLRSERWEGNAERFEPDKLDCPVDGPHWHLIGDGWIREVRRCEEFTSHGPCGADGILRLVEDRELGGYVACPDWHLGIDWVVVNYGLRESLHGTAFYCLTHAGFAQRSDRIGPATEGILPSSEEEGEPEMTFSAVEGPNEYARSNRRPVETVTWFGIYSNGRFRLPPIVPRTKICPVSGIELDAGEVVPVRYLPFGPPPSLSEKGTLIGEPSDWRDARLELTGLSARGSRSERLKQLLDSGAWKVQTPEVSPLDRLAAEQDLDRRDREQSDREDARATYAEHDLPHLRRKQVRTAFAAALREELDR